MRPPDQLVFPIIGQWYRLDDFQHFEVVAMDQDDQTIEIQHADGMIEEYDYEMWELSNIKEANPPKDYSGAYDMSNADFGIDFENYTEVRSGHELDAFK